MDLPKGFSKLLGNGNSFGKLLPKETLQKIENIFSPCCGLGNKDVRVKNSEGNHTALRLPFSYGGTVYNSYADFEAAFAEELGYGYTVYVSENRRIVHVISLKSLKDEQGLAIAPNFIILD
jgi:hypothetical protein